MKVEQMCRDHGRPGCLGTPDERYTMRFDDIGEDPIFWCSHCGPEAQELERLFISALSANPDLVKKAESMITAAEAKEKAKRN